jgi:hypothetical protein
MGSRRRTGAVAAPAGLARVDETGSSAISKRAETLAATCRRHEPTLDALLEAVVKLREANSALMAQNASLRTRNAVSMVERVRAAGTAPASVQRRRDGGMSVDGCSHGH